MRSFLVLVFLGCAASVYAGQQLPAGYIGDDTCIACHDNKDKQLSATLHGKAQNSRTPAARPNQSCETCHGPGKEHAETGDKTKIRVFTSMKPRDEIGRAS